MDIVTILKEAMKKELDRDFDNITPATTFEELALDSLDIVQLIMAIEEAFEIEIDDDSAESFKSIADLLEYIEAQTK